MLNVLCFIVLAAIFDAQLGVCEIPALGSRFPVSNTFTNNYGYGPHGIGPSNAGFDSFGYWKDKYTNTGLNTLYSWASYRNYYGEFAVHNNRYGNPAPAEFENLQEERFGPYYNGIWGMAEHSPYWNG